MIDLQKMFDAMADMDRNTRSRYHLTLGKLIVALEGKPANMEVVSSDGRYIGYPHSYRGYYADLSFAPTEEVSTVQTVGDAATKALGETFEGYKGGDFTMGEDAPLWFAHEGCCGPAIIAARVEDARVVLELRDV